MAKKQTISDALKQAIIQSRMAYIALERKTGVRRASIMRFLRGKQSIRLDLADKLAAYFGLELRAKRTKA